MSERLKEIPTTELIDAIVSRMAPCVIIGTKQEDGGVPTVYYHWEGENACCYALCHQMAFYIQRNMVYCETKEAIESEEG